MGKLRVIFSMLAVLFVFQTGHLPLQAVHTVHAQEHENHASGELLSSGVLTAQPAYPLSVVMPVFSGRNAPDDQRVTFPAFTLFQSSALSVPYGYQQLSQYLSVGLTGVDIIFPFHTFW